jgi:hypothetical protein
LDKNGRKNEGTGLFFGEITSSMTEPPVDRALANHVLYLMSTIYRKKGGKTFTQSRRAIEAVDLRKEFLRSLEEGYCGFELVADADNYWLTQRQRNELGAILRDKIIACGLHGIAEGRIVNASVIITTVARSEGRNPQYRFLPDPLEKRVEGIEEHQEFFRVLQRKK